MGEGVRLRGVFDAVRGLAGPLGFEPAEPTHHGLRYRPRASARHRAPRADVYLPPGAGRWPGVVLVHGGAFVIGARDMKPMRYLATRLVRAGVAVAVLDYRRGRLERAVDDVVEGVGWWHAHADRFGADPERVALMGLSAGATLALLASERVDPAHVHALVSVFGVYDLFRLGGPLGRAVPSIVLRGHRGPREAITPIACCRRDLPLTLLHGTADTLVGVEQARAFAEARRACGLPVRLHVYEGAPHGFFNDPHAPVADEAAAAVLAALAADWRGGLEPRRSAG